MLDKIKLINGIIVNYTEAQGGNSKGNFWRYTFYLDTDIIVMFYAKEKFYFDLGDKIEFYGEDCKDFFRAFRFKVLKSYKDSQTKIHYWINAENTK